jgi:hypothetical protein
MTPAPKSNDPATLDATDPVALDNAAVAEFTNRLQRAAAVRVRGRQCATDPKCEGCALVCALWFSSN